MVCATATGFEYVQKAIEKDRSISSKRTRKMDGERFELSTTCV